MLKVCPQCLVLLETRSAPFVSGVVSALHQVQRDQRKRLVHLATLRAQGTSLCTTVGLTLLDSRRRSIVRKNAERRDDALGPQWSSWVSKAVHKLVSTRRMHHRFGLTPNSFRRSRVSSNVLNRAMWHSLSVRRRGRCYLGLMGAGLIDCA